MKWFIRKIFSFQNESRCMENLQKNEYWIFSKCANYIEKNGIVVEKIDIIKNILRYNVVKIKIEVSPFINETGKRGLAI